MLPFIPRIELTSRLNIEIRAGGWQAVAMVAVIVIGVLVIAGMALGYMLIAN